MAASAILVIFLSLHAMLLFLLLVVMITACTHPREAVPVLLLAVVSLVFVFREHLRHRTGHFLHFGAESVFAGIISAVAGSTVAGSGVWVVTMGRGCVLISRGCVLITSWFVALH